MPSALQQQIRRTLTRHELCPPGSRVLVGLSGGSDSVGLLLLLRDASAHKGKIALFGLKKKVRTIFDLVRLNELFTITDSADAAVAALAAK